MTSRGHGMSSKLMMTIRFYDVSMKPYMYLENYILKEIQDIKPQYGVEDTPI
jgi:hypothetical protein